MKRVPQHTPVLALALSAVIFLLAISSVMLIHVPAAIGAEQKLPIYSVEGRGKMAAITIDTAWGDQHMEAILDILDEYQVKATFFMIGPWVDNYAQEVKEISDRGHEIGDHSATHPDMTRLGVDQMRKEIGTTADSVEKITGTRPNLFRPPFGACNSQLVETANGMGFHVIQWSLDSMDWKNLSADQITERVCREVRPGAIILFQNNAQYIETYLPKILSGLQKQGYELVPAGQLIYQEHDRVDRSGRQLKI